MPGTYLHSLIRRRWPALLTAALLPATALGFGLAASPAVAEPTPSTAPSTPSTSPFPPSTPTNFTASAVTTTSVTLTWTASTPGCCAIAGYTITYYQAFDDVIYLKNVDDVTTATISVLPARQYSFTVAAKDTLGHSSPSSRIVVMTPATDTGPDTVPPSAPADLTITGQTLSWSPSTDNVGVSGYNIYRFDGWYTSIPVATVPGTSYELTGDTPAPPSGLRTLYYVRARDAAGNLSIASNTVEPDTTPPTTPPPTTPPPSPTCTVSYHVTSEWVGGFVAAVTVRNTGPAAIGGWTLAFRFPDDQRITSGWNGTYAQSGADVTVGNVDWNGTIAPDGSVSLGFQGIWTTGNASPTGFTVNGAPCIVE